MCSYCKQQRNWESPIITLPINSKTPTRWAKKEALHDFFRHKAKINPDHRLYDEEYSRLMWDSSPKSEEEIWQPFPYFPKEK